MRKHNWACSKSVPFFLLITILSIFLPIFSDFFLSSKDFLLIYTTLKFHVSPSNNVPFSSQSLSSQHLNLLPRHFFHPMTSTLSHNHNWVGFCHPWNSDSVGYLIHPPILTVFGNQILYPGGLTSSLLFNVFFPVPWHYGNFLSSLREVLLCHNIQSSLTSPICSPS